MFLQEMQALCNAIWYACFWIDASISFRLKYLLEKLLKLPIIAWNRLFWTHIPFFYLFRTDYLLKNRNGIWKIKAKSDFDFIVNPFFEIALEPIFAEPTDVFIDIGAHIGKWTVFLAKHSPNARIFSFEPNPITRSYLEENLVHNGLKNVVVRSEGISSHNGKTQFFTPTELSALSKVGTSPISEPCDSVEISTVRLDDFIQTIEIATDANIFIKMDIEGHEAEAFSGMLATFAYFPRIRFLCEILNIEWKSKPIFAQMRTLGFEVIKLWTGYDYLFKKHT